MIYHIMFRDTPVIDIVTDDMQRVVKYEKFVPDKPPQAFWGDNINAKRLYDFLKGRCYEDSRPDLKEILAAHGLETNDPYRWCRKTHGVTYEDFYWIRYDDEDLTWEEVKIR